MAKLYKVRCSPNCPYEWCVILTNIPPQQGGGEEQGGGEGDGDGNSTNSNSNDNGSSDNGSSSNQNSGGDSQSGQGQQGSGDGASSQATGASDGANGGNNQTQQNNPRTPTSPPKKDSGKKPEPKKDSEGDGQDGKGKQNKPKEQPKDESGKGNKEEPKQEKQPELPKLNEAQQQELKKKPEPEYKPVFQDNVPLPDNFFGGGREAGDGETGLKDLGKHGNRLQVLTDQVFQARLRNVMKDNAFDRKVRGRKRGKLDMKSLYKVPAKVENVFTLKEARKNKHYNVILLVDQSGSMFDGRRGNGGGDSSTIGKAADCATFLAKSLDKVKVNYAVVGYDSQYRWHKKLDQTYTNDNLNKLKYDITHTGGGGTDLLKPLKTAFKELKKTPEYQNIVICLSDGQPSSVDLVRHTVHGNRHVADFIDVGIGYKPPMHNGIIVDNVDQLKPLLISELRKRIKRG